MVLYVVNVSLPETGAPPEVFEVPQLFLYISSDEVRSSRTSHDVQQKNQSSQTSKQHFLRNMTTAKQVISYASFVDKFTCDAKTQTSTVRARMMT